MAESHFMQNATTSSCNTAQQVPPRGFTLIELLVAISILAVVAVLGWRGLDGIVRARIALTSQLEQTRGMQLTFAQLQSDCAHIVNTTTIQNRVPLAQEAGRLTLVRTVFADDQPTRLQVVTYRLKEGVLTRHESSATRDLTALDGFWKASTSDAVASQEVVLQIGLSSMTMRTWVNGWQTANTPMSQPIGATSPNAPNAPPAPNSNMAPTGLEVSLVLQGREASMTKVFLLGSV